MYPYQNPNLFQQPFQSNYPIQNQYNVSNMQNQNILPPQQVLQIDGKESIHQLRMSPNSSVFLLESNGAIIWLCTSDGLGKVTAKAYDLTEHIESQPVQQIDTSGLEARIANIEMILAAMGGNGHGSKSDSGTVESKQDTGPVRKPWADQEDV